MLPTTRDGQNDGGSSSSRQPTITPPTQPPPTGVPPPPSSSSATENPVIFQEFLRNPLEFFGLTTLYDSSHAQWIGIPTIASARNPNQPSSSSSRRRRASDDENEEDDKSQRGFHDALDMNYSGMNPIPAEAAPSQTNAIGVQPFDAVFPPDGEHQVYAEDETMDIYRLIACAISLRVIGFATLFVSLVELGVGIWVDRYTLNLSVGSWWGILLPLISGFWASFPVSIYVARRIATVASLSIAIVIFATIFDAAGCVTLQGYTSCGIKQDITAPTVYFGKVNDQIYVDQCIAQSFASQGENRLLGPQNCYCAGPYSPGSSSGIYCSIIQISNTQNNNNCGKIFTVYSPMLTASASLLGAATILMCTMVAVSCTILQKFHGPQQRLAGRSHALMVQNIDQSNVLGRVRGSREEEQRERIARVRVREWAAEQGLDRDIDRDTDSVVDRMELEGRRERDRYRGRGRGRGGIRYEGRYGGGRGRHAYEEEDDDEEEEDDELESVRSNSDPIPPPTSSPRTTPSTTPSRPIQTSGPNRPFSVLPPYVNQ